MPINAGEVIESSEVLDQTQNINNQIMPNGYFNGWAVSAGAGLDVDVALGSGIANGFRIESTGSTNVGSLTPSTTNYIFANYAGSGTEVATFTSSVSATPTSTQVLLASAVTDGVGVTGVTDMRSLSASLFQKIYLNTAGAGSTTGTGAYAQVYTTTIPANTFTRWFKVTFTAVHNGSGTSANTTAMRAQANNSTTVEFNQGSPLIGIDAGRVLVTQVAVFESTEEDFTSSLTLDIDWNMVLTTASCTPQWILIEGV